MRALPQIKYYQYAFATSILANPIAKLEKLVSAVGKTRRNASANLICPCVRPTSIHY